MTDTTIIQYRCKPERAGENQRLIEAVMAELAAAQPTGLQYAAYRCEDGVSFTHVVYGDARALTELPAFQQFQSGSAHRLQQPPQRTTARLIGSYGS
jgi:hypothetical protein